jgi:hypothetical protein
MRPFVGRIRVAIICTQGGLARAVMADQPHHARAQVERDSVDRGDVLAE